MTASLAFKWLCLGRYINPPSLAATCLISYIFNNLSLASWQWFLHLVDLSYLPFYKICHSTTIHRRLDDIDSIHKTNNDIYMQLVYYELLEYEMYVNTYRWNIYVLNYYPCFLLFITVVMWYLLEGCTLQTGFMIHFLYNI
jgi:hypothetical protein